MCDSLAFKLVNLVLVENQKVLNGQSEGLDNLARLLRLARRHELAELSYVQEIAAGLRELLAQLLQAL